MQFSEKYLEKMKLLFGDEFPEYLACMTQPSLHGLRVNTAKISVEAFEQLAPFPIQRIPWIPNGFFYDPADKVTKHPYYFAGLYYIQEPSAMTPASRLPVNPGDRVLDLCAAPGGKATELGAKLLGEGLLIANDLSSSRAKPLLKNLELFGIANSCVISERPAKLVQVYPEYFDKILVDAPCSGEGMFRREPRMMEAWEEQGSEYYSPIQKELILQAAQMLKPGGMMLYSTCTFSEEENEEVIAYLLSSRDDMELVTMVPYDGFTHGRMGLDQCVRIFPHKMSGEGHFMALIQKKNNQMEVPVRTRRYSGDCLPTEAALFLEQLKLPFEDGYFRLIQDKLYFIPDDYEICKGLRYLRSGLYIGEMKKNRFEPGQALAMALRMEDFSATISLKADDIRTVKYLKGETIDVADCTNQTDKGWQLIGVDGFPLGFGKLQNGILKNKYYSGWRLQ